MYNHALVTKLGRMNLGNQLVPGSYSVFLQIVLGGFQDFLPTDV